VSAVSIGTWSHGGPATAGGEPVGWSGHDERLAADALARSWELGLDHWDTADVYGDGRAERLIGTLWDRVDRDRVFLASKVGWAPGELGHHYHPEQIRRRLERSLDHLGTGHLDLFYFHRCEFGPDDAALEPALEAMRALREAGKFRFLGLSDWDAGRIVRYLDAVDPDVVQPYRNVVDDDWEASGLRREVERRDLGVAFFSPLKHGVLLGKYERPTRFPKGDMRNRIADFHDGATLDRYRACRRALERRFGEHPQPVLHALVGALLSDSPTACALLGVRDPGQAEAAASAGSPLDADDAAWVRALYRGEA